MILAKRYKQNTTEYISFNLEFSKIHKLSEVLIFGDHEKGYQRAPNPQHINKIKNYITNDLNSFKLPTSIILAVDKDDIEKVINNKSEVDYLDIEKLEKPIFRIVDGQHRIRGMEKAISSLSGKNAEVEYLKKFPFNIICIITEPNNRSIELEIFVDINAKGKKVSTDLAELAKYNYQILEKTLPNDLNNVSEHIAMKAARELREENTDSVWNYAIKFDIHGDVNLGIIGVSSFRKSITKMAQQFLKFNNFDYSSYSETELIKQCNIIAKDLANFLSYCWDDVVHTKWKDCFFYDKVKNEEGQIVSVKYSRGHYLQKAMGVKAINGLIEGIMAQESSIEDAKNKFKILIDKSNVKSTHWKSGGPFAGLNSEGGFGKIRETIKNEITLNPV